MIRTSDRLMRHWILFAHFPNKFYLCIDELYPYDNLDPHHTAAAPAPGKDGRNKTRPSFSVSGPALAESNLFPTFVLSSL